MPPWPAMPDVPAERLVALPPGSANDLPPDALILLIGPSGAGKSTWAAAHFAGYEVLESDRFRGLVADDPTDQAASADAFGVLHAVARARSRRGLRTVVDATNLTPGARRALLAIARRASRPAVAVAFDMPLEWCLANDARRPGRHVPESVIRDQHRKLGTVIASLPGEGFARVVTLGPEDIPGVRGIEA